MQFMLPTKDELKKKYGYIDTTDSKEINFFSSLPEMLKEAKEYEKEEKARKESIAPVKEREEEKAKVPERQNSGGDGILVASQYQIERNEKEKKKEKELLQQTLAISEMEANVDETRRELGIPTLGAMENKKT
jgi:hypothetical protein